MVTLSGSRFWYSLHFQITSGVPQGSILGPYLLNVFINDVRNSIKDCNFLIFADDIKIVHVIDCSYDCVLLQSDINSVSDWCTANFMRLNVSKTRGISCSKKANILRFEYQLCHAAITHTSSIKDFDSKLYFHNHVDFIFFECIKLLVLKGAITFRFSSLDCLYMLYFTVVRSKLEYALVVWNSITSTDA
jgi:hypothetical protein